MARIIVGILSMRGKHNQPVLSREELHVVALIMIEFSIGYYAKKERRVREEVRFAEKWLSNQLWKFLGTRRDLHSGPNVYLMDFERGSLIEVYMSFRSFWTGYAAEDIKVELFHTSRNDFVRYVGGDEVGFGLLMEQASPNSHKWNRTW